MIAIVYLYNPMAWAIFLPAALRPSSRTIDRDITQLLQREVRVVPRFLSVRESCQKEPPAQLLRKTAWCPGAGSNRPASLFELRRDQPSAGGHFQDTG